MKKIIVVLPTALLIVVLLSLNISKPEIRPFKNHKLYPYGVSGNYAGAPGEANCTYCHMGNTQSGATVNSLTLSSNGLPITTYVPDSSYTVLLTMDPNPSTRGFQAVALTSSNSVAGTFTSIPTAVGSSVQILTNRATHTDCSNMTPWSWIWTAPSTNVGTVTFYVSTLNSDGSGTTSGDIVYLSQYLINASSADLVENSRDKYNFSAGYSSNQNAVVMNFNSLIVGEMYFNLVDLSGRSVFTYRMGNSKIGKNSEKIVLPDDIKNGVYVVNMFVHNNVMEQKVMIQK